MTTAATESTVTTPATASAPDPAPLAADRVLNPPLPGVGKHVPALDGVRGIAILLVLYQHFVPILFPGVPLFGWTGVDLFFVLSGFLITGILYDAKGGKHYFKNFYMRRVLRIFPLYYGVLAVFVLLLPWAVTHVGPLHHAVAQRRPQSLEALGVLWEKQVWLWLYGQNLATGFFGQQFYLLNHFWSLAVEEHFYLVWPLLIFLCSRRAAIVACVGVIVAALALRLSLLAAGEHLNLYVLTPCRMDSLAVGALLALLARGPAGLRPLARPARVVAGGLTLAVVGWLCVKGTLAQQTDPVVKGPGFTLLALMYGGWLVLSLAADPSGVAGRAVAHPALRFLGRYSYGIYVFHWPIMVTFGLGVKPERLKGMLGPLAGGLAYSLLVAAVSVAVAYASWHLYEKHWLRLKRYFDYRRPGTTPRPVAAADLNAP